MKISAVNKVNFGMKNTPVFQKKSNTSVDKSMYQNRPLPLYSITFLGNSINTDKKGYDGLIGYEEEKEYVQKRFIEPILNANNSKGGNTNLPNGIVFYGPTGCGKTTFANALLEQMEKEGVNVIDTEIELNIEENLKIINDAFKTAQEKFEKTGQYTVINLGTRISYTPGISKYLKDSAQKGAIWIGETDRSIKDIDESLLVTSANTIKVPLYSMNLDDAKKYLMHLLKDAPVEKDFDYKYVIDVLSNKELLLTPADYKYWTEDIKYMALGENVTISEDSYIQDMLTRYHSMPRTEYIKEIKQDKNIVANLDKENSFFGFIKIDENYKENIKNVVQAISIMPKNIGTNEDIKETEKESAENKIKEVLSNPSNVDSLKAILLNNQALLDFWIMMDEESDKIKNYTPRLKGLKLDKILQDKDKTNKYAKITLEVIKNATANKLEAQESYKDIIENDPDVTSFEKDILKKYQDSQSFFELVTDNAAINDNLTVQANTISALKQLSKEGKEAKDNAKRNIFKSAQNVEILNKNDEKSQEIVNYILNLVAQSASNAAEDGKNNILSIFEQFEDARINNKQEKFNDAWIKLVDIAQDYFNSEIISDLTERNINLLNSINNNMEYEDETILNAINNDTITKIEQKEFILRHKNDFGFKDMLKSVDYNLGQEIDNLLYYEATAKNITLSLLSKEYKDDELIEKFNLWQKTDLQENLRQRYADIKNRKFNTVVDKLDAINDSINTQGSLVVKTINEQTDVIKEFANNVTKMQTAQLEELIKANEQLGIISQNTAEIKQYTQVIARKQLLELKKDKYYKDIVHELTKLLPNDEQEDIKDFLIKVDDLVKNEKDSIRKKKILKAAAIVAGVAATAAVIYFAGPAIVAHLGSGLTAQMSSSIAAATAGQAGIAKMVGNSGMIGGTSFEGISKNEAIKVLGGIDHPDARKEKDKLFYGRDKQGNTTKTYNSYDNINFINSLPSNIRSAYKDAIASKK